MKQEHDSKMTRRTFLLSTTAAGIAAFACGKIEQPQVVGSAPISPTPDQRPITIATPESTILTTIEPIKSPTPEPTATPEKKLVERNLEKDPSEIAKDYLRNTLKPEVYAQVINKIISVKPLTDEGVFKYQWSLEINNGKDQIQITHYRNMKEPNDYAIPLNAPFSTLIMYIDRSPFDANHFLQLRDPVAIEQYMQDQLYKIIIPQEGFDVTKPTRGTSTLVGQGRSLQIARRIYAEEEVLVNGEIKKIKKELGTARYPQLGFIGIYVGEIYENPIMRFTKEDNSVFDIVPPTKFN